MYRPGGCKTGTFFSSFQQQQKKSFFFPTVHSSFKKKEIREKKEIPTSRLAVFVPTRPTGNDFLLKGGLIKKYE